MGMASPEFAATVAILPDSMDLHFCSVGGAALAVRHLVSMSPHDRDSAELMPLSKPLFKIITGWGRHRSAGTSESVKEAVCLELSQLGVCWCPDRSAVGEINEGCIVVKHGPLKEK